MLYLKCLNCYACFSIIEDFIGCYNAMFLTEECEASSYLAVISTVARLYKAVTTMQMPEDIPIAQNDVDFTTCEGKESLNRNIL